jgi:hypothetical protein
MTGTICSQKIASIVRGPGKKAVLDIGISKKQPSVQMKNVKTPAAIVLIDVVTIAVDCVPSVV